MRQLRKPVCVCASQVRRHGYPDKAMREAPREQPEGASSAVPGVFAKAVSVGVLCHSFKWLQR